MPDQNKRGGGGEKRGKMQEIDVCLIEKDRVHKEKIIIPVFLRPLQRMENKNRERWKKQ